MMETIATGSDVLFDPGDFTSFIPCTIDVRYINCSRVLWMQRSHPDIAHLKSTPNSEFFSDKFVLRTLRLTFLFEVSWGT